MKNSLKGFVLILFTILGFVNSVHATSYVITTSSSGWESSIDGVNYAPAQVVRTHSFDSVSSADALWHRFAFRFDTVRFRYQFVLDGPATSGTIRSAIDDDGTASINGHLVLDDHNGSAGVSGPFDITSAFVPGVNYLTGTAIDFIGDQGYALELHIQTAPVPEPSAAALALLGMGCIGLIFVRRKSK